MARPTDWHVLGLDGDPTPGVVESIQALAKEFGDFAHDVHAALNQLNSFGADATALSWVGQSADSFKAAFGPLPGRLNKLWTSYSEASDALAAYWPKLQAAQNQADAALRAGCDAEAEVTRANGTATTAEASLKTAQAGTDPKALSDAQAAHDSAQKNLSDAKSRLATLAASAQHAHDDLAAAAKECAKALHHAGSDGIHNKHWWQKVGETLSDIGGKIAEYAGDVSMVIAAISPILDIIAATTIEIPGLDVITGGLALLGTAAAAATTTTGTAMKMTGDGMQGHYKDMFGDAAALAMSRMGGKGKGGEPGEDGLPNGSMAAHAGGPGGVEDPSFQHGALGDDFAPGVHDPTGEFTPKEQSIADRVSQEGWRVDQRSADHTVEGQSNPDAMVRKGPDDPGTVTEFKTLESGSVNATKRNMNKASGQVPPGGEVVIDGRDVGLSADDAQSAWNRAAHQPGSTIADVVHVILGDGTMISFPKNGG